MTAYEIVSIFIGILALLIAFAALLLRCLPFSTKGTNTKNNASPV